MIDLGMPTLIELPEIEDCGKLCKELDLQFIELNMNLPQYQINSADVSRLKKTAEKYGIYYTIHIDENLNVCDFNPYVSKAYMQTVFDTVKIAKELSVPVLNMHLSKGVYFTLPNKKVYLFNEYKDNYLKAINEFAEKCERVISDIPLKISVENTDGYEPFQIDAIEILLKSPKFSLTFDIGHNYCIGGGDENIIMKHQNRLCHFHFHDAAKNKNHLALGEGEMDLKKYFNIAKKNNCRGVLETKTVDGLKCSVKWVKDNL